jgi:hypothetical protein
MQAALNKRLLDRFLVSGNLSLHGETRAISLHVSRAGEHFRGETALKQRDFGITPINIAGGAVKVKDELKIEFDVVTGYASPNPRVSSNRESSFPIVR